MSSLPRRPVQRRLRRPRPRQPTSPTRLRRSRKHPPKRLRLPRPRRLSRSQNRSWNVMRHLQSTNRLPPPSRSLSLSASSSPQPSPKPCRQRPSLPRTTMTSHAESAAAARFPARAGRWRLQRLPRLRHRLFTSLPLFLSRLDRCPLMVALRLVRHHPQHLLPRRRHRRVDRPPLRPRHGQPRRPVA